MEIINVHGNTLISELIRLTVTPYYKYGYQKQMLKLQRILNNAHKMHPFHECCAL